MISLAGLILGLNVGVQADTAAEAQIDVEEQVAEIDADTDEVTRLNIIDSDTQVIFCHQCEAVIVDNTQQSDDE